jgi:branched-chain amino acid transport system substrate-binding protein
VVHFFAEEMKPLLDSTYGFADSRKLRLAVVYKNDAFGQGVVAASEYWIQADNLPIEIVIKRPLEASAITFQGDLTAIKDAKPDAVYVVHDPDKSPEIVKEGLVDVGLKTVYLNIENNEDPTFYTLLKENGDKQLLESKFAPFAEPYIPAVGPYVESYMERYNIVPGMMGADTYDAFYIVKDAIERAGTLDKKAVRDALETTNMDQMLIMTETGKIQFSVGEDYHEIAPVTFIEQLYWNETLGECRPVIVWPASTPGVSELSKADFVLPDGYEPGSP